MQPLNQGPQERGRDQTDQAKAPGPASPRPADVGFAFDIGMRLGISIVGGILIGYLADNWLHTSPLFTFVGLALGLGAAGHTVWTVSKRYLGQ